MIRGADRVAAVLAMAGTDTVFSLSGNQIMPLYDACIEPGIRIIHTRHESAAVFMAEAYAQLSSRPGVALVTAAPGFANALGALYSAKQSETPVILLSGDSPAAQNGRGAFQEFDQCAAASPFVKASQRVTNACEFQQQWQDCLQLACSGIPGPVHLALPFDMLNQLIPDDSTRAPAIVVGAVADTPSLPAESVSSVTDFIAQASRPLVLLGPAMCRASQSSLRQALADALSIVPVKMESPRGLGDPVLGNIRSLCRQADRVLLLGKKPDFTLGLATTEIFADASFAAVLSGAEAEQLVTANLGDRCVVRVDAGAQAFAQQLCTESLRDSAHENAQTSAADKSARNAWNDEVAACLQQRPQFSRSETPEPLHPVQITTVVEQALLQNPSPAAVLIFDGGEFGQWAQAGVRGERRMINGPSGAIGGSIACATGAAAACPDSPVVVMLGDGTAGFYLAELETMAREQVPAIVIVGNDSCWNAEHQIQLAEYGESRTHSCTLPDELRYDIVAQGLGLAAELVTTENDLQRAFVLAMRRATETRQGTLLNVIMQGVKAPQYS